MQFHDHPLLNTPHLVTVLLRAAEAGRGTLSGCVERLRALFGTTGEDPHIPDATIRRELVILRCHLEEARLIATEGGRFVLTHRGREALERHPAGVDTADLMAYPEYADFIHRLGRPRERMDPRDGVQTQGFAAYGQGAALSDNPHAEDSVDHLAWESGWFEGFDEEFR